MLLCGLTAGGIAYAYDSAKEALLRLVWERGPEWLLNNTPLNRHAWLYIFVAALFLGTAAGLSVKVLGYPGDLPDVIRCVHSTGAVPLRQAVPMAACSLLTIASGASLGPEAPLVAIVSSMCGWLSRDCLGHGPATTRKMTLIGMSAGLSAFFGEVLGGALFALEVCHTMGAQYYEVTVYCVGAGAVALVVFRGCGRSSYGAIWAFPPFPEDEQEPDWTPRATHIVVGASLGAFAAALGLSFTRLHRLVGRCLRLVGLGTFTHTTRPVLLTAVGASIFAAIGVLLPPTLFWSEAEMQSLAWPGAPLPHVWPKGGIWGQSFDWDTWPLYLAVGGFKLLAISVGLQAGLRGGVIFPLYFAGACFGRAVLFAPILDSLPVAVPPVLASMSVAAGLCVVVTRTPFASSLILTALSGVPEVAAPVLAASLTALFLTTGDPFFKTQQDRSDVLFVDFLGRAQTNGTQSTHSTHSDGKHDQDGGSCSVVVNAAAMDSSAPGTQTLSPPPSPPPLPPPEQPRWASAAASGARHEQAPPLLQMQMQLPVPVPVPSPVDQFVQRVAASSLISSADTGGPPGAGAGGYGAGGGSLWAARSFQGQDGRSRDGSAAAYGAA